jgi:hypothetical protein
MTKHSPFCYIKPGPGFLDYLAWVCGLGIKSHGPRKVKHPPTSAFTVTCAQLALDGFARAVVRGSTAGGYGAQSLQLSRRVQDHGPRIMGPVLWRLAL